MSAAEPVHLVVPQQIGRDRAEIWVGLVDAATDGLRLGIGTRLRSLPDSWQRFEAGGRTIQAQRVPVDGLSPRQSYPVRLLRGPQVVAEGSATTLPGRLPSPGERPFTVLLGSCFCVAQDPAGIAGAAVRALPAQARADLSILCGDQVYLDSPGLHFLICTHRREELAAELLANYLATWSQRTPGGGFRDALASSATYLSADDHELWNNAPLPTPYVRDSWTAAGRSTWLELARTLYALFQAPAPGAVVRVDPLSFFVADTRLARTPDSRAFMDGAQLAALEAWTAALSGPGALVVGQPIFVEETGWRGILTDRGLADYAQYRDLVRILSRTRHDLLVLTGDVHFGRVATCQLPNGRRVIELISSPLALVDPLATGKWKVAPTTFPARAEPAAAQAPVTTDPYARADEHFLSLAFAGVGSAVRLTATSWSIAPGRPTVGRVILTTDLH